MEGRFRTAHPAPRSAGSGGSAGSGDEFLTYDSVRSCPQKVGSGASGNGPNFKKTLIKSMFLAQNLEKHEENQDFWPLGPPGDQMGAQGAPRRPKGSQREPKGSSRRPKGSQKEVYIFKNSRSTAQCGRYVNPSSMPPGFEVLALNPGSD